MKKIGDLYWTQLSMWDFSDKDNLDAFSFDGFHFELLLVTDVVSDNQWKVRNVKVNELSTDELNKLIPEHGHNWSRVMGNDLELLKTNKIEE